MSEISDARLRELIAWISGRDTVAALRELLALRERHLEAVELVADLTHRLNTHLSLRQGTHWDGCEAAHNDCALLKRASAFLAAEQPAQETVTP